MKYLLIILFIFSSVTYLQENSEKNSFYLNLAQDPANGFYPTVGGSIFINNDYDFTFYGIFWTQDLLGGNTGGTNLYTEFGIGLNIKLLDESLIISPSIGIIGGHYHSGGGRPVIGDGYVPGLSLNYQFDNLTFQLYGIAWMALRKESENNSRYDNFNIIFNPEYQLSRYISLGIYFEHYFQKTSEYSTLYSWLGPSINISPKENLKLSFTTGFDFVDYTNKNLNSADKMLKDYYKLSANITF